MEQPPPQKGFPDHVVEMRPGDSPRTRRFRSDEPVVTPGELHNAVNGYQRRTSDPLPSPRVEPHDAPAPPFAEVAPLPAPALEPRPPPSEERLRRRRCLVRRACFCLTLQQGAYCIGVLQVTNGILTLLLELMYLIGTMKAGSYVLKDDLTGTLPGSEQRWGPTDIAYASLSGFLLLQELICLFFAALLLHGVRTERAGYVRAWLLYTGVMLCVGVGTWAGRLTLEFMYKPSHGGVLLIRCLIYLSLPVYFLLVVRSYYYQLRDAAEGLGPEGLPLMRGAPPPYSEEDAAQAPALPPKQPLETSFEAHTPVTLRPPDNRFDLSLEEPAAARSALGGGDDDDEGGFAATGGGGGSSRGSGPAKAGRAPSAVSATSSGSAELRPVPRVVATVGRDGRVTPVLDSGVTPEGQGQGQRASALAEADEAADTAELRPLPLIRRPIAGRMVLPPLPPGHRESLQHVALDERLPPPAAPTSL